MEPAATAAIALIEVPGEARDREQLASQSIVECAFEGVETRRATEVQHGAVGRGDGDAGPPGDVCSLKVRAVDGDASEQPVPREGKTDFKSVWRPPSGQRPYSGRACVGRADRIAEVQACGDKGLAP